MLGAIPVVKLPRPDTCRRLLVQKTTYTKSKEVREYCLIVEGAYLSESEAEHALRDPFIEDWVEQTGRFRIHNMDEILITPGVTLGPGRGDVGRTRFRDRQHRS